MLADRTAWCLQTGLQCFRLSCSLCQMGLVSLVSHLVDACTQTRDHTHSTGYVSASKIQTCIVQLHPMEHYKSWMERKIQKNGFSVSGSQWLAKVFTTMKQYKTLCSWSVLLFPLRVAHVEYWLQFKLVSYSSLSLQTLTGIKTLGKSEAYMKNVFHTEVKENNSLLQLIRSFLILKPLSFSSSLREKVLHDLLVFISLTTVGI